MDDHGPVRHRSPVLAVSDSLIDINPRAPRSICQTPPATPRSFVAPKARRMLPPTQSAGIRFSPASGVTAVLPRRAGATTWRAAPRFLQGKGIRGRGQGGDLRLCAQRSPEELIPAHLWWTSSSPELRPEDLVEPTGQGVEELVAIRDALVRDPLRPIGLAVQEMVATGGNIFRCQSFHAGVVTGPLLVLAGLCKLYTVAPNLFMDIVLGYMFYKLSVLAAHLKRNGKSNDICARIQCVIMAILFFKCNNPTKDIYYRFTKFIWTIAFEVYGCKMLCEFIDLKHPKEEFEGLFKQIQTLFKEMLTTLL